MLRTISLGLRSATRTRHVPQTARAFCTKGADTDAEAMPAHENALNGKATRANIRDAFASRCVDSIRYEYFAQRADLEAETDAASLFRSLTETAKQQAMGYMELLEEYGDADFGDTLRNLEVSAQGEKASCEGVLREHAVVAGREELDGVEEYFEDMADAAEKSYLRFEMTASMYDMEGVDEDQFEDAVEAPEKATHKR